MIARLVLGVGMSQRASSSPLVQQSVQQLGRNRAIRGGLARV